MTKVLKKTTLPNRRVSLNFRLFLVTIVIALLVIGVILWSGFRDKEVLRKEKFAENQSELKVILSQLDAVLEVLENTMVSLSMNDSDFKTIAAETEWSTDIWLANQRVIKKISSQANVKSLNMTPFVYFPGSDTFYNYQVEPEVTQAIKNQIAGKKTQPLTKGWQTIWCEERAYLCFITDYNNYYVGAWGAYDSFYEQIDKLSASEEIYCFADENGRILSGEKEAPLEMDHPVYRDEEGKSWYLFSYASTQGDFHLVKLVEEEGLEQGLPGVTREIFLAVSSFTLLFLVYILCLYRWIMAPMNHLRKSMGIIQSGNLAYRIPPLKSSSAEFVSLIDEFNFLMNHIEHLKIKMYEARLEQNETKLEYLSRQIQPHFILNTLNTLYNYSESDVKEAKKILRLASKYYRYVVNVNSRYVQLEQELEHIESYLSLQKIRYPRAFDYEVECEPSLKIVPVPPFIIESFVGNAVKYGIRPGKPTLILVKAEEIEEFHIRITIADTGNGFSEDSLDAVREFLEDGTVSEELGVGIKNSIARLRLIYQDRARVHIYNQEPHGAVVEIELMLQEGEKKYGYSSTNRG